VDLFLQVDVGELTQWTEVELLNVDRGGGPSAVMHRIARVRDRDTRPARRVNRYLVSLHCLYELPIH
jgi:hypothetical protein